MPVTIGNSINGGWSTITPKPDSNASITWTNQQGTDYFAGANFGGNIAVGDGTRFVFVSAIGNNINKGTKASPVQTSDTARLYLRDGFPDWMLFKRGDSFPIGSDNLVGNGPAFSGGLSSYTPQGIGTYDDSLSNTPPSALNVSTGGSRPLLLYQDNTTGGFGNAKNIAIQGLVFSCPQADPSNSQFDLSKVFSGRSTSGCVDGCTFLLIEDCKATWYNEAFDYGGNIATTSTNSSYIRRNVIKSITTTGIQLSAFGSSVLEQNLISDTNFQPPAAITISVASPGVFTWSGTVPAGWGSNDRRVKLYQGWSGGVQSVLPSPLVQDQLYFVTNIGVDGANKFRLSTTVGGPDINLSGGSGSTFWGLYFDGNNFVSSHAFYLHDMAIFNDYSAIGPYTLNENVCVNADTGQVRGGGYITNNSWINTRIPHNIATPLVAISNTIQRNVYSGGGNGPATIDDRIYNSQIMGLTGCDVSQNIIANGLINIGDQWVLVGPGFSGFNIHDNYIYDHGTTPNVAQGSILTLTLNAAGTGGTGAVRTFDTASLNYGGTDGTDGTYTVEFRTVSAGPGTGCTATVTVTGGSVVHSNYDWPPYFSDGTINGGGGPTIVTGGTLYSTGDILIPWSGDPNASKLPTGFSFKVGAYPTMATAGSSGISLIYDSGSSLGSGAKAWITYQNTGSDVIATSLSAVAYSTQDWGGGTDYVSSSDVLKPSGAVEGISGIKLNVASVSSNMVAASNHIGTVTPNPTDTTLGAYYAYIGSPGSYQATPDGFVLASLNQSMGNWNTELTADAYNTWVRSAFGIFPTSASTIPFLGSLGLRLHG